MMRVRMRAMTARLLLAIREKALGPDHPDTATSLTSLALLYVSMGEYARAAPLLQRALAIREKALGPHHPDTANGLINLALLDVSMGEYARAEPLYQRALAINEKALGPDHLETASSLNLLAELYRSMEYLSSAEDYARAEPLYQRALAIREKALGPDHPDTATSLNNQAGLYLLMRDYARAEPLYQRALAIREQALGPDHPDTATSLNDLAELYRSMRDSARAEPLCQRALAIREKALGRHHPDIVSSLVNLARLYRGDVARQESLLQRARAIKGGKWRPDRPYSLSRLAGVYRRMGNYLEAEPLYQYALAIQERALGPGHLDTAEGLSKLAWLYYEMGDYARAEPLYQRALTIEEKAQERSPSSVEFLALLYYSMGDYARAEPLFRRICEENLDFEHAYSATHLSNLALVYVGLGDSARAEALHQRALAIREKVLGPHDRHTAKSLNNLAYLQIDLGRPDAALDFVRRALESGQSTLANVLSFTSEQEHLAYQAATLDPYCLPATLGSAPDLAWAALRFKGVVPDSLVEDRRVARFGKRRARRARRALSVTVEELQAVLPEDSVLVEILLHRFYLGKGRFEHRYGAVVLGRAGLPRWVVLAPAGEVDGQVHACRQAIRERSSDEALSPRLHALYDTLWAPLEKSFPPGTTMVLLSPDGELNFLSWATLLSPGDRFLAEDYDLRYLSIGRDLLEEVGPPAEPQAMALGGVDFGLPPAALAKAIEDGHHFSGGDRSLEERDLRILGFKPLPGTAVEVDDLEKLLLEKGWKVEVARGREASEAWVQSVRSPRLLHLGTHGFFLPNLEVAAPEPKPAGFADPGSRLANPMHRSGLALAGAQATLDAWRSGEVPPNHGLLTAEEVGTLDLSGTWLVTLSACETGQGKARAGEGVLGLRRGFVQAGARNLLMTLWTVSDEETARFMTDFYQAALKDDKAPAALARTQREWLVRLRQEKGLAAAVYLAGRFLLNFQGKP